MSEVTFFRVTLKKGAITSNKALVDNFMKYLGCFDNPHIWRVSVLKAGERSTITQHKLGDAMNHTQANLQKEAVHDFLKKTIADNPDADFDSIYSYGAHLFDADKYGFAADTITAGRDGLGWSGLNPRHYGLYGPEEYYKMKGVWLIDPSKERHADWVVAPLPQIQDMLFGTLKRIIEAFDPILLALRTEYAEELLGSSNVLYFKDPYLFCMDLKQDDSADDAGIVKKLNEIKSVLSLSELERILKENATSCNYEVLKSSYGGIGILRRLVYEHPSKSLISGMAAIRRVVRERGVDLPIGRIEEVTKYEAEYIREMKGKENKS